MRLPLKCPTLPTLLTSALLWSAQSQAAEALSPSGEESQVTASASGTNDAASPPPVHATPAASPATKASPEAVAMRAPEGAEPAASSETLDPLLDCAGPSPLPQPEPSRLAGGTSAKSPGRLPPGKRRPMPDYDGVPPDPDPADNLLWFPRVALFPVYLVSEYLVRQPLGWLSTTAEEQNWPALVSDFFTFGPEKNVGIIPTGLIDFGFRPSVGLYFFWNDAGAEGNDVRLRGATWGADWLTFSAKDRLSLGEDQNVSLVGAFLKRPDQIYHGEGPRTYQETARYSEQSYGVRIDYDASLWRSSSLSTRVGMAHNEFEMAEACCSGVTVAQAVADGRFAMPVPGDAPYASVYYGATVELDTRPRRHLQDPQEGSDFASPAGSGFRLNLRGDHGRALRRVASSTGDDILLHWVNYGATMGGFLDLNQKQRVVGVSVIADFADPITADAEIPFPNLITLGGDRPLRGFLSGRLRGRSSIASRLDYTWPVWVWLDGAVHYEIGNVFGEHLDSFDWELLRQSFGVGVRSNQDYDHVFELLVAAGTETFGDGSSVESLRFVMGATSGF